MHRGEAEKSVGDILEGCQKVAGGRAKRYPRFRHGKKSYPGGVPEPVFCAEHLAARREEAAPLTLKSGGGVIIGNGGELFDKIWLYRRMNSP